MVTLIVQVLWSYRQEDRSINQLWVTFWSRLVWLPDRHTDWPPGGRGQHTALAGTSQLTQPLHWSEAELVNNKSKLWIVMAIELLQTTREELPISYATMMVLAEVWIRCRISSCHLIGPELRLCSHHKLTDTDKQLFPALHQLPMIYQDLCQPIVSHLPKNRHPSIKPLKLK